MARGLQGRLIGLALLVLCALLTLRDPLLPAADLDSSWVLAMEFAARHGLVFGRDMVFTFGPYAELSTQLYSPQTFPLVFAYSLFAVVAVFWTALANRAFGAMLGIAACFVMLRLPVDALIPLALFGVFLAGLRGGRLWPLLLVALCGPLILSKLTFAIILVPLLLAADVGRAAARQPPVLTLTLALATLAALVAVGQPLDALPAFVATSLEVVLGYGRSMQLAGSDAELAASLGLAALASTFVALCAARARRDPDPDERRTTHPAVVLIGFVWLLFALFKMAFVRQDIHTLIFHAAAPAAFAMAYGWFDRPDAWRRPPRLLYAVVLLVILGGSFYWRSVAISHYSRDPAVRPFPTSEAQIGLDAARVVQRLGPRLSEGLGWATGDRWAAMPARRAAADASLRRPFPAGVSGTVDIIPWDAAPLIASGLDYHPRPVAQSYSAYTPALQQLDADHFAGPRAPDTLVLRLEDIDNRLPTLMLGPSLPVIGRRYDAADRDPLGLILKLRSAPRAATARTWPIQGMPLETWVSAPGVPGRLLMAHVEVRRTWAGKVAGVLLREPSMAITLRTADGRETTYRFVPGMAGLGVAVSPVPAAWRDGAAILLDPAQAAAGQPVTALRLSAGGASWAFAEPRVRFEEISFAPGFGSALK